MMSCKKGVVDIGPVQLVGLILAIVLIITTVVFFARLSGIVAGGGVERATEVSFISMVATMNDLIRQPDACIATPEGQNVFVGQEYAVVGFSRALKMPLVNGCVEETVQRPLRPDCLADKSCLCWYKTQQSFKDVEPKSCVSFDVDYLLMPKYGQNIVSETISNNMIGYTPVPVITNPLATNLFIFGECDTWGFDSEFGTQRLYLERGHTENNEKFILIGQYDTLKDRYDQCTQAK